MESPLNSNLLLTLVDDSLDTDISSYIKHAKRHFERQNMSEGVRNLIMAFEFFRPYLRILCETWKDYGPHKWRIDFGVHIHCLLPWLLRLTNTAGSPIHASKC